MWAYKLAVHQNRAILIKDASFGHRHENGVLPLCVCTISDY